MFVSECQPARLAFGAALQIAREQIPEDRIENPGEYMVLCSIHKVMAEVYAADPAQRMLIDKESVPAAQVQAVFRELDIPEVQRVIRWYLGYKNEAQIVSTKRYLRTMLYNAYFEVDADIVKGRG